MPLYFIAVWQDPAVTDPLKAEYLAADNADSPDEALRKVKNRIPLRASALKSLYWEAYTEAEWDSLWDTYHPIPNPY